MKTVNDGAIDFLKSGKGRSVDGGYIPIEWFKAGYDFAKQWISVEEEFPEKYISHQQFLEGIVNSVLVKWVDFKGDVFCSIAAREKDVASNKWNWVGQISLDGINITHWRPINIK